MINLRCFDLMHHVLGPLERSVRFGHMQDNILNISRLFHIQISFIIIIVLIPYGQTFIFDFNHRQLLSSYIKFYRCVGWAKKVNRFQIDFFSRTALKLE